MGFDPLLRVRAAKTLWSIPFTKSRVGRKRRTAGLCWAGLGSIPAGRIPRPPLQYRPAPHRVRRPRLRLGGGTHRHPGGSGSEVCGGHPVKCPCLCHAGSPTCHSLVSGACIQDTCAGECPGSWILHPRRLSCPPTILCAGLQDPLDILVHIVRGRQKRPSDFFPTQCKHPKQQLQQQFGHSSAQVPAHLSCPQLPLPTLSHPQLAGGPDEKSVMSLT